MEVPTGKDVLAQAQAAAAAAAASQKAALITAQRLAEERRGVGR